MSMQRYTVSELMRSALDSPEPHWQNRVSSIRKYGLIESEMEPEALTSFWCTFRPFLRSLLSLSV